LDIGCGSYPYFLLHTDFTEKYGIDPSLTTLKIQGLDLKKANVTKQRLPFGNNYFNAVTMLAVFEHIEHDKLQKLIREINRVLVKGGILVVTTPAPWADKLLHQMARISLISKEEIHEHKHNHHRERIEGIIKNGGFKRRSISSGFFELGMNMWFVAKK
jgi:ubiquinone/menaquinone biosynthesis C-methylase UbiE